MTRRGWFVACALLFLALAVAPAQVGVMGTARGFKLVDYYSNTSGAQKKKSVLTGSEGFMTNDLIYLVNPRIEHYREDGSLIIVATAQDAYLNRAAQTVSGTNMISFRNAETNLYQCGRGFLWQQTNSVLIISNESFTWIDQAMLTNRPSRK